MNQSNPNKKLVGYTCGVYDLFHVGHLNLLRNAKSLCDTLIVGVTTDDRVIYKGKRCIIPYEDRAEIVRAIRYVDCVVPQKDHDKVEAYHHLKYDILFVGDDWYKNENWKQWETELKEYGVKIIYFPYTQRVSSTKLRNILKK